MTQPDGPPCAAERVGRVLHALVRARKAHRFYPPANPQVREAMTRLAEDLTALFPDRSAAATEGPGEGETVYLGLSRDGFVLDGEPVGLRYDGVAEFARELYSQGVKLLWFASGATEEELDVFVPALCPRPGEQPAGVGFAEVLAALAFDHIGVERVETLRLVERDRAPRDMDLLEYLRQRQVRRGGPAEAAEGEGQDVPAAEAEDVSDLAGFFLEMAQGSKENEQCLFNTLTDPHRLAETLNHVSRLQETSGSRDTGVSMNVLRQTLHHIADSIRALPDEARGRIMGNIAEAIQSTDTSTHDKVINGALAPTLGHDRMGVEIAGGFSDEQVAGLLSSHIALHDGTANTVSNFLSDFSADPTRRETISRLVATNLATMDNDRLREIGRFLERREVTTGPEPDAVAQHTVESSLERERAGLAQELLLTTEETKTLEEAVRAALDRPPREDVLLVMLDLCATGSVDRLSEAMLTKLDDGLAKALEEERYDFILRLWQVGLEHANQATLPATYKALRPSLAAIASHETLLRVLRRMYAVGRDDPEYERLFKLLRFVAKRVVPMVFDRIATEKERLFRQFLLTVFLDFGEGTIPFLSRRIEHPDWFVTRNVAHMLGQLKLPAGAPALERVLHHDDFRVRREVLAALAAIKGDQAEALLIQCLEDDQPAVQILAAEWLGVMDAGNALPALVALLTKQPRRLVKEPDLATGVVRAVGRLGRPSDIAVLQGFAARLKGRKLGQAAKACEEAVAGIERRRSAAIAETEGA